MTKSEMMGDLIVMHEDVTTVNVEEPHTGEEDISAKKELLADDNQLYDEKHVTIQVARNDDMHMDEDTKYVNTLDRHDAYEAACKMDVDKTHTENIGIMRADTSMLPGTATLSVKRLHTREDEDHLVREDAPADNKMVDKYEYSDSLTETQNIAKMLAYMDENYKITSQTGDEDEPTTALEREKPNVRENP